MKAIFSSKVFWITAVVVMVIFFFAGINITKEYKSEMRILLLPRNEVSARNIDQILRNAEEIPLSLSFYNKMTELNADIEDSLADLSDSQRKSAWNESIKIDTVKKSGIIRINVFNKSQSQAEIVSRQVASSLITVLSKYYDIKTELDMRIIDGPIISFVSRVKFLGLFLLSLLTGLVFGSVAYFSVEFFSKKENLFNLGSLEKYFKPDLSKDSEKSSEYFSTYDEDEAGVFDDIYSFEKKGSAPANLPVADESIFAAADKNKELAEKSSENMEHIVTREATSEEVKARLNKLLNS